MDPKDWLLLAISAAEGNPVSPVQIQKCLFLLGEKIPKYTGTSFYTFVPHNYGPLCVEVYDDEEILAWDDYLVPVKPSGQNWIGYAVTPKGMERASTILKEIPENVKSFVNETMAWCRSKSFRELIEAIYDEYPQYRENSVFQG